MPHLYLDNNATTPLHPEVAAAMSAAYQAQYANAASQHGPGQRARRIIEDAREGIAGILGASVAAAAADQVIFTSGGTEANNLALRGLGLADRRRLLISATAHPSVTEVARQMAREGLEVVPARVDRQGQLIWDAFEPQVGDQTRLVSILWGNNETGVLQAIEPIAVLCRDRQVPLHVDAVQVAAKLPVDFRELGATSISLAAHKFHGPRGIGALVVRHGTTLEPQLRGGFQQLGLRPGTEPVELVVGMFVALQIWQRDAVARRRHLERLRDQFESELRSAEPAIVIHGAATRRLPHTTSASFVGVDRQPLAMALDLAGVACSTGSACASGSSEPSPVLQAMGLDQGLVDSALRFSVGALNTSAEITSAVRRILQVYRDLRHKNGVRKVIAGPRQPFSKGV